MKKNRLTRPSPRPLKPLTDKELAPVAGGDVPDIIEKLLSLLSV